MQVNTEFLATKTNYLSARQIASTFEPHFVDIEFCERLVVRHETGRSHALAPLANVMPVVSRLYGALMLRTLFARRR